MLTQTNTPVVADNSTFGGPSATQAAAGNAVVAAPVTPPAIDVSKIGTVPTFNLPPAPTDTSSANASTLGSIPTIASITDQANTLTPAEQTNKTLNDKLVGLADQEAGKTIATTNAQNSAGVSCGFLQSIPSSI
jgi:hypothetical protein